MSNRTSDQADKAAIRSTVERVQDGGNFQVFKAGTPLFNNDTMSAQASSS